MPSPTEYEYRGLLASTWDLLRGDPSIFPDRDFYRDIILDSGEPALDVGCGTGRLLLEYLADGLHVDVSPEMITYTIAQIEPLFHRAGFTGLRVFSGFTDRPATLKDDVFCIAGIRP